LSASLERQEQTGSVKKQVLKLAKVLEDYGLEVSREAITLAKHAGRTTVKEEDIRLAVSWIKKV
jgi:histone H3/H4